MTKDELISELRTSLDAMCDWAREISDQYLDGEPGTRALYAADLQRASDLQKVMPE